MNKCPFCYQPTPEVYHPNCCKKMFGTTELPLLTLDKELLDELANDTVNRRIAVTGVQPKLSVEIEDIKGEGKRLTIVGLWGNYILKPQHSHFQQMPEVEDLTMHLASIFKIITCKHCLLRASDGTYVYLTKRFDRIHGKKIHMEDFCQLGEFQTEQKYNSSYERCGKLIYKYCTNSGLDVVNYFELLLFAFLTGNNDMHMKNFSILHQNGEINLAPAYDLINAKLLNPKDIEDVAMTFNGRKSKITGKDFDAVAKSLKIPEVTVNKLLNKYMEGKEKVFHLIDQSYLNQEFKDNYKKIWMDKINVLVD
jgi:serine/threonine-protein kinase HipA